MNSDGVICGEIVTSGISSHMVLFPTSWLRGAYVSYEDNVGVELEADLIQDYEFTPYIAELMNTLTNLIYSKPSFPPDFHAN
jgi:anaerobic C4-dicarboxylate transporter